MAICSFLLEVEQNNLVLSRFHSSDDISSSDSQLKIFSTCTVVVFFLLRHVEKKKTIDPEKIIGSLAMSLSSFADKFDFR